MKKSIIATILFIDLMNSTEMSKNLTLEEYDNMIVHFQNTMYEVISSHLEGYGYQGNGVDCEWSIAGDEMRVFLYSESIPFDVRNSLLIAVKAKLAWLVSPFNERILKEGRPTSRIGAGIDCGKVVKDTREWRKMVGDQQPHIEGYAVNVAKRIESASLDGKVYQIMVGDSFYRKCQESTEINVSFSRPMKLEFKGLGLKIPVYEILSFINFEILSTMPPSFKEGIIDKMEQSVRQPNAEPWAFITLLRHYISLIASGGHDYLESYVIELAQQALKVSEYKSVIFNIIGWLHAYGKKVRNPDLALYFFDQSLSQDPTNQAALLHKARILESMGQEDSALATYQKILHQNHDHPEALRKLSQRQAAQN